jgi:hypothetical protein
LDQTWITNQLTENIQSKATEESNLAQILPTDFKPADITAVMNKQARLTSEEREKLLHALIDFQEISQGK